MSSASAASMSSASSAASMSSAVKFNSLVNVSVPQMLSMMVDLEEDEDWAMADELEDDDFDR